MNTKSAINAALLSLLYAIAVFAGECLGIFHPLLWVFGALPCMIVLTMICAYCMAKWLTAKIKS